MLILTTLCVLSLFEGYQAKSPKSPKPVEEPWGSFPFCFYYNGMGSIKIEQLKGQWWEYQSFNVMNPSESNGYDCSVFNFYPENTTVKMLQDYIRRAPGTENKDHTRREWKITRRNPDSPIIDGNFNGETWADDGVYTTHDYTLVDTDYNSWLIVAVCNDKAQFRGTYVLTRSQKLNKHEAKELEEKVRDVTNKKNKRLTTVRGTYTTKKNSKCKPVDFPDTMQRGFPL